MSNKVFSIALSGLRAVNASIESSANNITNGETVGYKKTESVFASLCTKDMEHGYTPSGISMKRRMEIETQGTAINTGKSTNMAILGNSFFVVNDETDKLVGIDAPSKNYFTKDGSFSPDRFGYLTNNSGYSLCGIDIRNKTDPEGKMYMNSLQPITLTNTDKPNKITTSATVQGALPGNAKIDDTYYFTVPVFDSLGVEHDVDFAWKKTDNNTWSVSVIAKDADSVTDANNNNVINNPVNAEFHPNGSPKILPNSTYTITWNNQSTPTPVKINFGTADENLNNAKTDGLIVNGIELIHNVKQDGSGNSSVRDFIINERGELYASYDDGSYQTLYFIPLARFTTMRNLSGKTGTTFEQIDGTTDPLLEKAGDAVGSKVVTEAVESSNVDTTQELTNMITAQSLYTAIAKTIKVGKEMQDTLFNYLQ